MDWYGGLETSKNSRVGHTDLVQARLDQNFKILFVANHFRPQEYSTFPKTWSPTMWIDNGNVFRRLLAVELHTFLEVVIGIINVHPFHCNCSSIIHILSTNNATHCLLVYIYVLCVSSVLVRALIKFVSALWQHIRLHPVGSANVLFVGCIAMGNWRNLKHAARRTRTS